MADVKVRIIAVDEASETLKKTGDEVEKTGKKAKEAGGAFEGMGKTMATIAGGLGLQMGLQAIVGGLKNAIVGSFELAAALEQTTVGFTTMLGSGEAAQGMLNDLRSFAAKTPFQFDDLTKAASRMIAMGTAAEDVIPTLTAVGDAAAGLGLGSAGVDRITLALGQMGAKGKIGGDDLRQLAEAGVPALRYLAEAAGVTTAEMQKMISDGLVPADQGVKILVQSMEADFGGLMAEQAKTASGALSNLEDATATLGTEIGQRMIPVVKIGATALADFANSLAENIKVGKEDAAMVDVLQSALARKAITLQEYNAAVEKSGVSARGTADHIKDMGVATELAGRLEREAAAEHEMSEGVRYRAAVAIDKLTISTNKAKDAALELKAALALQSESFSLVSGASKDFDKDTEKLAETTAKHQKVVDDLTTAHGKNQAAILAGNGTIVDNTAELEKSSIAHRDLKQDMQQLNDKRDANKISGDDYTLALDKLNIKIRDQDIAHQQLTTTQGTGLTALQLAATETGNYNTKLAEAKAALDADAEADRLLQVQTATRIKEGIVLEQIASDAKDGLRDVEIERIQGVAKALGISDSEAITGMLNVQAGATLLADARAGFERAFEEGNVAGMKSYGGLADYIGNATDNKILPTMAGFQTSIFNTNKKLFDLRNNYDGIQSKDVELRITTVRQYVDQAVAGGSTVAAAVAKMSGSGTAGQKAHGGAVMGGAGSYLVGELGPELFNPSGTGGTIVPNNRLMGGGGLAIGTLNVYGVQSASELFNQLSKEARARGLQFAVN